MKSYINTIVYPNPVRDNNIRFQVSGFGFLDNKSEGNLHLEIFNIRGQLVYKSSEFQTKNNEINFSWNRRDSYNQEVPSGVYFYRINSINNTLSGRFLILK